MTNRMVPALLLMVAAAGCDDSMLDVFPVDEISEETAIIDEASARAALVGAYSGLQLGNYYQTDFVVWVETLTDNATHTGTFESYADADLLFLRADVFSIQGIWEDIYDAVNRANLLIQRVPEIDVDAAVEDEILGQAYALRALHYFNLVRGWGDVPLVLEPPADLDEAAQVSRSAASAVFAQIESDLAAAETRLDDAGLGNDERIYATSGFVDALQAKVALYQEDWATAEAEAREVMDSGDYDLASSYAALFTADGDATIEDVFRVQFTPTDFNNLGYYYQADGRLEVGATADIVAAYPAGDVREAVTIGATISGETEVVKFPTTIGGEDFHVIRYAEVLLILAEALAEQGGIANLTEAVGYVNEVRDRADVATYTYGVDLLTQQDVLDAIYMERRLELAFEGDRWFDLVRTGLAATELGSNFDAHEALWPVPQAELDVAPNLSQNPGY